MNVALVDAFDLVGDHAIEVVITNALDMHRSNARHEDVALRIDGERGLGFIGTPEFQRDLVANGNLVIWIEDR